MDGGGPAVPDVTEWNDDIPDYADLIAALIIRPSEHAWDSVRAAWLFQAADAFALAGYPADAAETRERAVTLVRSATTTTAGG